MCAVDCILAGDGGGMRLLATGEQVPARFVRPTWIVDAREDAELAAVGVEIRAVQQAAKS